MIEYFIYANSNAAPFCSDDSTHYSTAETPDEAMEKFRKRYNHPAGLFSAGLYASADAYHKGKKPLLTWLSDRAKKAMKAKP